MAIIGTAGHIDHGKSALVQALTSIDPDRLPEEKRREMTIDLGFAWLPLSPGGVVGIVDVPGHEDFVKNMIAGVGGIDAALLVVAQDEGWMPQTEEHLRILDFLDIKHGVVALTKVDLSDDPDWLDLVEAEIRERLKGTGLAAAPIVRVSARRGTNIPELRQIIEDMVSRVPPNRDTGKPRLPVDRIFSIKGSGSVVTGTLLDGTLSRGDEVYIFPRNRNARIRALESYKETVDSAPPGTRVALNLVGLEKEELSRGDIIFGEKRQAIASRIIDARIGLIPQLAIPLKSNTEYKIYLGTREITGQVILLGRQVLKAGESALAQLRFREPVATRLGDHLIIRRASPAETIGGGTVLDPAASRHRFRDIARVTRFLESRESLELEEVLLSELEKVSYAEERGLLLASYYPAAEVIQCAGKLQARGKLIRAGSWIVELGYWQGRAKQAQDILAREHSRHPLQRGLPQAELESRLHLPRGLFNQLITAMIEAGEIARREGIIALPTHQPSLSPEQERLVSQVAKLFATSQTSPPTRKELATRLPGSEAVVRFMCQQGTLMELPDGVLLESQHYDGIKKEVVGFLKQNGSITIQQMRSIFGFSRKYTIPVLNKMEEEGLVRRRGEERILSRKAEQQE